MDAPVSDYLPQLRGSVAGEVTMHELATHRAGYAEVGGATLRRGLWSAPLGRNFFDTGLDQTIQEITADGLSTRGAYSYSSLGAAAAGQATAAAAGMSYPDLMRTRLFAPLGMTDTAIQSAVPLVPRGRSASGLLVQPWVAGGDAPAGAAVSTARDLTILATAILDGTAPGLDALQGNAPTSRDDTTVATFWHITTGEDGRTITWHNGKTGGYTSYMGLDLEHHRAVIVLSDVAKDVVGVGVALLGQDSYTESASPAGCT
jgi:CubicO group peptidase (beta-lactamase class C family)